MSESTIVELFIGGITVLFTIIGYLLAGKDAAQERKLTDLQADINKMKELIADLRVEVASK